MRRFVVLQFAAGAGATMAIPTPGMISSTEVAGMMAAKQN